VAVPASLLPKNIRSPVEYRHEPRASAKGMNSFLLRIQ
jgi:hypothetical protein